MSQIYKYFSEACYMVGKITQAQNNHINSCIDIEYDCRDSWNNLSDDAGGKNYFEASLNDSKFYVYVEQRIVLGYIIFSWSPDDRQIVINQLMVRPDYRRIKIGSKLMDIVNEYKPKSVEMTIVDTNLTGQLFLRAMGLKCIKIKRNKYLDENNNKTRDGYKFIKKVKEEVITT